MSKVTLKNLLEAGVHFGHQTRKWNPKMGSFIFGEKNKIHIIDLQKTLVCLRKATRFIEQMVADRKELLFIGTKKQAQISLEEAAKRAMSPYVSQRWLGGMLTNFATVRLSINKMKDIKRMEEANDFGPLTKKEINSLKKERAKLEKNLAGIENMGKLPGGVFIVDTKREHIAVREAQKLGIPIIALLDTNADPDGIDFPVPGNDDAIRAIHLMSNIMADAVLRGKNKREAAHSEYAEAGEQESAPKKEEHNEEPVAAAAGEKESSGDKPET